MKLLKCYSDTAVYVDQVASFADKNKQSFGFLARSAYEELALKDQLWVALEDEVDSVAGYLIFGGTYPSLRVFQLFVNPKFRSKGIAKTLIKGLINYGTQNRFSTIRAKVAAELPANKFWEQQGFRVSGTELGGSIKSKKRRLINHRVYLLDTPDLFVTSSGVASSEIAYPDRPILSPPVYVLDLNVLFDLIKKRGNAESAKFLFQHGFNSDLKLCVTPEFCTELERHTDSGASDPILEVARSIPVLSDQKLAKLEDMVSVLRKIIFPDRSEHGVNAINDNSDLKHLSHCILSRVDGFVTSERALLRSSKIIERKYGVRVVSPDELTPRVGQSNDEQVSVKDETVVIKKYESIHRAAIEGLMGRLNISDSVTKALAARRNANENIEETVLLGDGGLVAFSSLNLAIKNESIDLYLFVDETNALGTLAIDHFLERAFRQLPINNVCRVELHISQYQPLTRETATKKGFVSVTDSPHTLAKIAFNGYLDSANWQDFASSYFKHTGYHIQESMPSGSELTNSGIAIKADGDVFATSLSAFDFESLVCPGLINHGQRECVLVPIKEGYANELLGGFSRQLSLLPNKPSALMLEKAYFRSPVRCSYISRGSLVAFYVSGQKGPQNIVGIARVIYASVVTAEQIGSSLSRQGVIEDGAMKLISNKNNMIHVFTFDNFKQFPSPLSFAKAKELGLISPANLTTIERLSNTKTSLLLKEAYRND